MTTQRKHKPIGRWKRSLELTKASWRVLILDKELIALPLIGALISLLIMALWFVTFLLTISTRHFGNTKFEITSTYASPLGIALVLAFIVMLTFISNFIAGAVMHGALERFKGGDPTIRGSLAAANKHKKSLFLFSVLTSTVGLALQLLQERLPFGGKILVWLGNLAWMVATFFALPFIMTKDSLGPIDATKKSTALVKKVWGESIIINGGMGLVAVVGMLLYEAIIILAGIAIHSVVQGNTALIILGVPAFIGLVFISAVISVLNGIAKAAIFYWATTGVAPETFSGKLLRSTMRPKAARKIFNTH